MPKSSNTMLNNFIPRRIIELNDKHLPRDREYLRLRAAYRQALDQLTARLDPDRLRLFLDLEAAATALVICGDELLYRQG